MLIKQFETWITDLQQPCDIMIDQIRAIDNKRLIKKNGKLPDELIRLVKENLQIVLDLLEV